MTDDYRYTWTWGSLPVNVGLTQKYCPKCGNFGFTVIYVGDDEWEEIKWCHMKEHLKYTCNTCGYQYIADCLDKEKKHE